MVIGLVLHFSECSSTHFYSIFPYSTGADDCHHRVLFYLSDTTSLPEHVLALGLTSLYRNDCTKRMDLCFAHLSGNEFDSFHVANACHSRCHVSGGRVF